MNLSPLLPLLFFGLMLSVACSSESTTDYQTADYGSDGGSFFSSSASFVSHTDPRENAFKVSFPEGWQTKVSLERPHQQIRTCGISVSPDGKSRLFLGDPSIPTFMQPNPQMGMNAGMNTGNPLLVIQPLIPASRFFPDYLQRSYGRLPGFRITSQQASPAYEQRMRQQAQEMGLQAQLQAVEIRFEFMDQGNKVMGKINGGIFSLQGVWGIDINGYLTQDDPAQMDTYLGQMLDSYEANPQWQQQENRRNQQAMQQQNQNHQQRMNALQNNFQAHQNKMQQRYNASDAQFQQWQNNQASQDRSHAQTIDNIWDRQTINNGSQQTTVDAGYNHYYVNPSTNEYFGTDAPINSGGSDFEEWDGRN